MISGICLASNPTNALGWMIFLAEKYSSLFLEGTLITLYVAVAGTILGFILGYLVGIIEDIKINKEDSIVKKVLVRILKIRLIYL